jgi:hypothetical protein
MPQYKKYIRAYVRVRVRTFVGSHRTHAPPTTEARSHDSELHGVARVTTNQIMTEAWTAEALAARQTNKAETLRELHTPNPRNQRRLRFMPLAPFCPNFRDMGGLLTADGKHRLRYGVLYRHGRLSETDAEQRGYIDALGIRTFVDFRSDDELKEAEAYASAGARLVPIKMQDPAGAPKRWGRRASVAHPLAWAQVGKPPAVLRLSKGDRPRTKGPLQVAFEENDFAAVPELARSGMPQVKRDVKVIITPDTTLYILCRESLIK